MKLKTNLVTIDRGVLRKSFGVLLIVAGIILVVAVDGRGALGCLAISVLGAAEGFDAISPDSQWMVAGGGGVSVGRFITCGACGQMGRLVQT